MADNDTPMSAQIGACLNEFCEAFYDNPILLSVQVLLSLVLAEVCACIARDVKPHHGDDKSLDHEYVTSLFVYPMASVCYIALLCCLFWKRAVLRDLLTQLRTVARDSWCWFQWLRAGAVVAVLRLFVYISDLLTEKKGLTGWSVGFFFVSHLHVVSLTKLFTIKDLISLSDSLLAVGIMVLVKLPIDDKKPGATEDEKLAARLYDLVRAVFFYVFATLMVLFRFSRVPYGHYQRIQQRGIELQPPENAV